MQLTAVSVGEYMSAAGRQWVVSGVDGTDGTDGTDGAGGLTG